MKQVIVILTLIGFCCAPCAGQIPGYQGKRLLVNYDFIYFPAILNPNVNNETGVLSFNTKNKFSIEYVTNRTTSMGLGIKFYNTAVEFDESIEFEYTYRNNYYGNTETITSNFTPDGFGKISATHFSYFIKIFDGKTVAPLGTFSQIEFEAVNYQVSFKDDVFDPLNSDDFYAEDNIVSIKVPDIENNSSHYALAFSFTGGKQRILFNRMVLRYGYQVGWVLGGLRGSEIGQFFYTFNAADSDPDQKNYIKRASKQRLWNHNFINLTLGIGLLAY